MLYAYVCYNFEWSLVYLVHICAVILILSSGKAECFKRPKYAQSVADFGYAVTWSAEKFAV